MTDTPEQQNAPHPHDPYAAFRVPGLWQYLLGATLIQIGMGAQAVAFGWEIYLRSGSSLSLGLVGGVAAIPMLLFSLPAGYLADRFDRRKLITLCLCGVALCSLCLAVVSSRHGDITLMYLLLFCDAAFMTLERPSGSSIFPMLVPPEKLENAMKWRFSTSQIAAVAGPALGGLIIQWSIPAAYVTNAAFALVFIGLLFFLPLKPSPAAAGTLSIENLLVGARFIWGRKLLLAVVSLDMFAVLLGGAVYLMPVYAKDILHVGEQGLGWLRAAPAVGAFITAILLAHLPPMRKAGRALLLAVAGFGVATMIFGLSRTFWLSWVMLLLTGALDNVSVVVRHTLIQLLTPDHMRGRVSAVNSVFIGSSNELGGLESGLVAQAFSPVKSVVSGGIGTILVVGLWTLLFPALRRFGKLTATVEELTAEEQAVRPTAAT